MEGGGKKKSEFRHPCDLKGCLLCRCNLGCSLLFSLKTLSRGLRAWGSDHCHRLTRILAVSTQGRRTEQVHAAFHGMSKRQLMARECPLRCIAQRPLCSHREISKTKHCELCHVRITGDTVLRLSMRRGANRQSLCCWN